MRTVQDVLNDVRVILQDQVDPFRYTTGELLMYINNGLYELKRLRPDIWLSSLTFPVTDLPRYVDDPVDLATALPFNTMFYQPLVLYVAGYAELRDDEFTQDARAATLLKSFAVQLSAPAAAIV